ncbi:MAG: nucleotidyltransferase [Parcubacteria group bacterium]|nr:nucleotidyltransferase [Parcubacteria group bacterium]
MIWEDTFRLWGKSPGRTEKEKMENTENAIKNAIQKDNKLSEMDISVFAQGSYSSKTNVKHDSDVDVCVRLNSMFFTKYPDGKIDEDYGNTNGNITFAELKNLVEIALINYFGSDKVIRGNKAFDIHSNSYRVDADVVPAFAYRYYNDSGEEDYIKPVGMGFVTDRDVRIYNWPKQVYNNGIAKQSYTGKRYKKMVRIVKKLRNRMQENNIIAASNVPSFLIESLVWNVSDDGFNHDNYYDDVKYVIMDCFNKTINDEDCKELCEVNDIKYLFHLFQPWTRAQAHSFFNAAWDYMGFK